MVIAIVVVSLWIIILMVLIDWMCASEYTFIPLCIIVVYLVASGVFVTSGDSGTHSSGHHSSVPFTAYYSIYHSVLH